MRLVDECATFAGGKDVAHSSTRSGVQGGLPTCPCLSIEVMGVLVGLLRVVDVRCW